MRKFDYFKLVEKNWDSEILSYVSKIHEYKGKQELFFRQKPVELTRLIEIAKIQSIESSNRIEGIVTTVPRLKSLMANKTTPRNRAEEEILGYRNALKIIHENYAYIPITANYILQLHKELLKLTNLSYGGNFKNTANEIAMVSANGEKKVLFKPLEPFETPDAIRNLCNTYQSVLDKELLDALILIPCFILDFLCIHPFNDGNGRMSRLLTLLMLYKNGYLVGQYISIEKMIAESKEDYYQALSLSDKNWHKEKNDPKPFIKYMLGIILACYKEFESRITIVGKSGIKSSAYDIVKHFVLNNIGIFTKQEALISCPSLGSSSVEAALKKLVENGVIVRMGAGKKTHYVRKDAIVR